MVTVDNLNFYGGFQGNETSLNQRNWTLHPVIFDGNNQARILNFVDNSFKIDGINFTRGKNIGAAIYAGTSTSTFVPQIKIFNSNFYNNSQGAAFYFHNANTVTIENCTFLHNSAAKGAAIEGYSVNNISIDDCLFDNNTATNKGGAIYIYENLVGLATINNTVFQNNTATDDGGAIFFYNCNTVLQNSQFIDNQGGDDG